jgi:hypothetical protein
MSRNTGAPASPLARIAARLRERLPEADGWHVRAGGEVADVRDGHLRLAGFASAEPKRRYWMTTLGHYGGQQSPPGAFRGDGWPERLADALADALLQKEPPR